MPLRHDSELITEDISELFKLSCNTVKKQQMLRQHKVPLVMFSAYKLWRMHRNAKCVLNLKKKINSEKFDANGNGNEYS